mmetsp:Transcript_6225/g.9089  ORF Transcript_6225/g.9089 Transcript_6225/m.9089 type:complete len:160 (-) Transcript_6225:1666-2145(-)
MVKSCLSPCAFCLPQQWGAAKLSPEFHLEHDGIDSQLVEFALLKHLLVVTIASEAKRVVPLEALEVQRYSDVMMNNNSEQRRSNRKQNWNLHAPRNPVGRFGGELTARFLHQEKMGDDYDNAREVLLCCLSSAFVSSSLFIRQRGRGWSRSTLNKNAAG